MTDLCSPWRSSKARTQNAGRAKRSYHNCTPELFEQLWVTQDGKCAICGEQLTRSGFMRAQVDHEHATGKIRGLLCRDCNTQLGRYEAAAEQRARFERYLCQR